MQSDVEQYRAILVNRLESVAARLKRLTRNAEQAIKEIENRDNPSFSDHVAYLQSDLVWGMANLGIDSLIANAAMGDRAREREEKESK